MIPKTKRGKEWQEFSDKILTHIETYTVPQLAHYACFIYNKLEASFQETEEEECE